MLRNWAGLFLLIGLLLPACQRQDRNQDEAPEMQVDLEFLPNPAQVGPVELHLEIKDPLDQPVRVSLLEVRGDMNHAGMTPSFGEGVEVLPGTYRVPFEWTMGGDWTLTVTARLVDGRELRRSFPLRVKSAEGPMP